LTQHGHYLPVTSLAAKDSDNLPGQNVQEKAAPGDSVCRWVYMAGPMIPIHSGKVTPRAMHPARPQFPDDRKLLFEPVEI